MNKYVLRGSAALVLGALITGLGYILQHAEQDYYKYLMLVGVLIFGLGFIWLLQGIFRKIDRHTLLNARTEKAKDATKD